MSSWAERAKAAVSQKGQTGTAKTAETTVFGVLAVSPGATGIEFPTHNQLVSVLAVPMPSVFEETADWHSLDSEYLAHHFNCLVCISAGRGSLYGLRCGTGAELWRAYLGEEGAYAH